MFFYGCLHINIPVKVEQQKLIFINSVQTLDVVLSTYQEWLPVGTDGEIQSRESMLLACLDNNDHLLRLTKSSTRLNKKNS